MDIVRYYFTREEITLRDKLMHIYITQEFIIEKYRTTFEMFGRVVRTPEIVPDTTHFYGSEDYKPTPQHIRKSITDFLSRDKTIQVS